MLKRQRNSVSDYAFLTSLTLKAHKTQHFRPGVNGMLQQGRQLQVGYDMGARGLGALETLRAPDCCPIQS